MKNSFIITLLSLSLIGTLANAQTKKPTSTKKPSTTVKSTAPKTTTTKTTTTTTYPSTTTTTPVVVEEKKTTTTTTTSPTQNNSTNIPPPSSTTIQQSSGPSKGGKKTADPKPEKVVTPKPERVREPRPERVREPRPEKVRNVNSGDEGGVRFGIRAEATQIYTLQSGGNFDLSPGVNAGLIVNIPISPVVSIQPEVLYSMSVINFTQDASNYAKSNSGSILAPLMVNINLGQGSTKFMVNLGGYAGYLLNQNEKSVVLGTTVKDGTVDLMGEDRFDYGAAFGIGVKIKGNFIIEARSFYGLKDNSISKAGFGTIGIGYFF